VMADFLRALATLFVLFFLPGFTLVQALFPRRNELDENDDFVYRIVLGIGLSLVLIIFIGFFLGSITRTTAEGEEGFFKTPYILSAVLGLSGLFFVLGWWRGAYPFLGRTATPTIELSLDNQQRKVMYELMSEWRLLKRTLTNIEERIQDATQQQKARLERKKDKVEKRLREIDTEILSIGKEPATEKEEVIREKVKELVTEWKDLKLKLETLNERFASQSGVQQERTLAKKQEIEVRLDEIDDDIEALRKQ